MNSLFKHSKYEKYKAFIKNYLCNHRNLWNLINKIGNKKYEIHQVSSASNENSKIVTDQKILEMSSKTN